MNQLQNYGFNTQQYEDTGSMPVSNVTICLDLAKVITAYTDGMKAAFQMGRQARADELCMTSQNMPTPSLSPSSPVLPTPLPPKEYLGVFDRYAYGVYDDQGKFNNSSRFWDVTTLSSCSFGSYDEALNYARHGVANSQGVTVEDLPPLTRKINWRQQV